MLVRHEQSGRVDAEGRAIPGIRFDDDQRGGSLAELGTLLLGERLGGATDADVHQQDSQGPRSARRVQHGRVLRDWTNDRTKTRNKSTRPEVRSAPRGSRPCQVPRKKERV